jgi:hypothetical protein
LDHEGEHSSRWAAVSSIAAKVDCMAQTLHEWVKKAERDRLALLWQIYSSGLRSVRLQCVHR